MIRFVDVLGKDSEDFLARVTAGTVKGVRSGEGRRGLLLTGQSKVVAQFDLLRLENDHFRLAAPEECVVALAEGLEGLHFSEAISVVPVGALQAGLRQENTAVMPNGTFSLLSGGAWPAPVPGWVFDPGCQAWPGDWEWDRIASLVPWPGKDWDSATPALEAGMLPWIDRYKGCYPGQEVVELSLNVGHPARVLVAVEGESALAPGERLSWGAGEGRVTSVAFKGGKHRALVRVPWAGREFVPTGLLRICSHW